MKIQLSDHFTYKKLFRFVFPSVVMMAFTSIYGAVDGLFITNFVGKTPFAALNIVYPFVGILGGIGFMMGAGGAALVGKTMGEGDNERANRYFSMVVLFTIIAGIIISAVGCVFMRPVSKLLGATEEMLDDCVTYGRICLAFNVFYMLQNQFQGFFVAAEKPKLGLWSTVAAGLTNVAMDALFVAGLRMGVAGAALATGLSQAVGGLFPILYFSFPNSSRLRLRLVKFEFKPLFRSATNGVSELLTNISMSVVGMLYNFQLMRFNGEDAVAANGVIMYVQFFFAALFIGFTIGASPIISFHFGAENHDELKNMLKKCVTIVVIGGFCMIAAGLLIASPLARVFVGYDKALMDMTRHAFSIYVFSFVFIGFNFFASSFFTALNNGGVSAAISFLRTLVFKVIWVFALPALFGLEGIWWADLAAEGCAFIFCLIVYRTNRNKYHYM